MCCQPGNHSACQLRKPLDVVATKLKMHLRWNHARPAPGPESRKPKRNGSHNEQGLEVKDAPSPSGRGRKMSLTFPLIDQALALIDPQRVMWRFINNYTGCMRRRLSDNRISHRRIIAIRERINRYRVQEVS